MSASTMLLTIDNTDTRLQYSPGWFVPGSYNTSTGQSGTLSSANGDVSVTFIFPVVATEFHYYAIQRCCGGWYGICFDADCDPNAAVFATIDGVNRTANGDNLPEAMYTRNFGETGIHTVTLKNMADSRFGGNSQITLDSFVLRIPENKGSEPRPVNPNTVSSTRAESSTTTVAPTSTPPGSFSRPTSSPPSSTNHGGLTSILPGSMTSIPLSSGTHSAASNPPTAASSVPSTTRSSNLRVTNALAGILAGAGAAIIFLSLGVWFVCRCRMRKCQRRQSRAPRPFCAALSPEYSTRTPEKMAPPTSTQEATPFRNPVENEPLPPTYAHIFGGDGATRPDLTPLNTGILLRTR